MTAEKAILGSMIQENHLIQETIIKPHQLEDPRHRALLTEIKKIHQDGQAVDFITLSTLTDLDSIGGISYINELTTYANPDKFDNYESLVLDEWKNREKRRILTLAKEEDWTVPQLMKSLDSLDNVKADDHTSITDALVHFYEAPWSEESEEKGIPTGFRQLDQMTNGSHGSEITIIGARPSMGKTDVMLHLAKQAGWHGALPIIFSLEMPERRLTQRLIASTGGINRGKMRNLSKSLTEQQKNHWAAIMGKVDQTHIQIFDGAGQTVPGMRAKARKLIHQYPNRKPIIIIDYLTLIRSTEKHPNKHSEVTEITWDLKMMSKDFDCPVIVLAQLSRGVEQRTDKRPTLADLRESGSIEQDADAVMFLYREKYYEPDSNNDELEIIVAKQRNGPIGTVKTRYNEHTGEILDDYYQAAIS